LKSESQSLKKQKFGLNLQSFLSFAFVIMSTVNVVFLGMGRGLVGERGSAYKFALKSFKNILQIALELWVST
jgi:hypothetical protein